MSITAFIKGAMFVSWLATLYNRPLVEAFHQTVFRQAPYPGLQSKGSKGFDGIVKIPHLSSPLFVASSSIDSFSDLNHFTSEDFATSPNQGCTNSALVTETALRSGVKAICWRLIAGAITLMTSLKFSGSISTAMQIVSSDFTTKVMTMFVGERLMNQSQAGRKDGSDNASRSLAKALIWRLFAICNTMSVSFMLSGDMSMASKIAGSDAVFKTALMFLYERVWARIEWGVEDDDGENVVESLGMI